MADRESYLTRSTVVCVLAVVCCALWGSAFPCVKIGYEMFRVDTGHTASILLFAGLRFTLAGILAVAIGSLAARRALVPKGGRAWRHILVLSLLQTVAQYFLFYIGLAHTTGVRASIIGAANAFAALLVAALLFRQEKLTARKCLGCLVGFAGVVLVNLDGGALSGGFRLTGEGFVLLSTVAYAFSSVCLKRYSGGDDPVLLSGWQFILGGCVMAMAGAAGGGTVSPASAPALLMLLYLGCISAVAYSLWGVLLKHNPVSRVTVFSFMTPVFGVLLSALLLDESGSALGVVSLAALVLVCVGIYIVNGAQKERQGDTMGEEFVSKGEGHDL